MIIPTRSIGEYDPWLDYNDDGRINMRDIGATCDAFSTLGDPTKNVTIMHNTYEWLEDFNFSGHTYHYYRKATKGYRQITLYIFLKGPYPDAELEISGVTFWIEGSDFAPHMDELYVNLSAPTHGSVWKTYDVIGSEFGFGLLNPTDDFVWGRIAIYMTT